MFVRERLRHGRRMQDREQEDFLLPVFFSAGFRLLRATVRHERPSAFVDGCDFWSIAGALTASLWWETASPDAGRTLAAHHMPCAPFAWGSDTSSSPSGQRRGPSIPVRAKVFSGWGEHASGGAVLLRKAPLPRVFAVWKAEKICPVGRFCPFILVHQYYCARNYL